MYCTLDLSNKPKLKIMKIKKFNWLAIFVGAVACFFLGFLWYGVLFLDTWAAGNGLEIDKVAETMSKNGTEIPMSSAPMIINTIAILFFSWFMHWLQNKTGGRSINNGLSLGILIGVVMFLGIMTGNLFAANPISLTMVDGTYTFITWILLGLIIGAWPQKKIDK